MLFLWGGVGSRLWGSLTQEGLGQGGVKKNEEACGWSLVTHDILTRSLEVWALAVGKSSLLWASVSLFVKGGG